MLYLLVASQFSDTRGNKLSHGLELIYFLSFSNSLKNDCDSLSSEKRTILMRLIVCLQHITEIDIHQSLKHNMLLINYITPPGVFLFYLPL